MTDRIIYWVLSELYVAYRQDDMTKNDAWNHLVSNPLPFLDINPVVDRENNQYRAAHIHNFWRWKVRNSYNPEKGHGVFLDENGNRLPPLQTAQLAAEIMRR